MEDKKSVVMENKVYFIKSPSGLNVGYFDTSGKYLQRPIADTNRVYPLIMAQEKGQVEGQVTKEVNRDLYEVLSDFAR